MDFEMTNGYFDLKGKLISFIGNSITSGSSKNGEWKRLLLGIEFAKHSVLYAELFGNKAEEQLIFPIKKRKNSVDNNEPVVVKWEERNNIDLNEYRFQNEVKISLTEDQECVRLNSWDAIEYIEQNVQEKIDLYVKGRIKLARYNGKIEKRLQIQELYILNESQEYGASFNFKVISNELIEDRVLETRIISKKRKEFEIIPYEFVMGNNNVLNFFQHNETKGNTLSIHGTIECGLNFKNVHDQSFIHSKYEYFKVLGGSVDKDKKIVYNIDDLDLFQKQKEEQEQASATKTGQSFQQAFGEEVNEFGF